MSDTTPAAEAPKPTPPAATDAPAPSDAPVKLPDDHPLVKTLAAQKEELRTLKEKARRLDEIEEANKTEAQKSADRLAKAENAAREAEAKVLRREVAIEHKLDKDDAAMLDTITDEDAMRRLAARLAKAAEASAGPRSPKPDPNQGRPGAGSTSTADLFAAAVEGSFTR